MRAIRVVVRDHDWRTAPPVRHRLAISEPEDGGRTLRLDIDVAHRDGDVDFRWVGEITFRPGSLGFSMRGEALRTFRRNRIGIVILHPIEDAGRVIDVTTPDGETSRHRLPDGDQSASTTTEHPGPALVHRPRRRPPAADWRRLRDRGPAQLDGRLVQDLLHPARRTLSGHGERRRARRAVRDAERHHLPGLHPADRQTGPDVPVALGRSARTAARVRIRLHNRRRRSSAATIRRMPITPPQRPCWSSSTCATPADGRGWNSALAEARAWRAALDVRLITDEPQHIAEAVDRLAGHPVCRIGVFDPASHVTESRLWTALTDQAGATAAGRTGRRYSSAFHRAEPDSGPVTGRHPRADLQHYAADAHRRTRTHRRQPRGAASGRRERGSARPGPAAAHRADHVEAEVQRGGHDARHSGGAGWRSTIGGAHRPAPVHCVRRRLDAGQRPGPGHRRRHEPDLLRDRWSSGAAPHTQRTGVSDRLPGREPDFHGHGQADRGRARTRPTGSPS